jgi:hypothetical protein
VCCGRELVEQSTLDEAIEKARASDFEQLLRLRKTARKLISAADVALATPGMIRGRDQLSDATAALREALVNTGEQS